MHYSGIKWNDVANGKGMRISLFVSGCHHHCKGCFNPETWDFQAGAPFTPEVEDELMEKLGNSYIRGLSLLGGEPLAPENQEAVLALVQRVNAAYPEKDIWCYSGYLFEDLLAGAVGDFAPALLGEMDVLVDGLFEEGLQNPMLAFRGSSNQRVIDLPASLALGTVVEKVFDS